MKIRSYFGIRRFKAFLMVGGAFLSTHAVGQSTQGPAGQEPSEIVVTAQRVSEPLQKTPASISVLSADTIETAGVQDFNDLSHLVAGLTFNGGYRSGVPQISLRGIPTVQGGDPPAAFVVDGVQVPALDFVNQDLLDIANVQVLRGPQGGIYGRNAIGGAVVIETQKPTNQFHDTLTVDAGNGGYFRGINTASGPIVPGKLWAKLTLEAHHFDGLIDNAYTQEPADTIKDYAGRLEILAKPTSTTTIDLTYAHTQGIDGASYYEYLTNHVIGAFNQYKPNFNLPTYDHRFVSTYAAKIDQETPVGILTSITQYAKSDSNVSGDADWTATPVAQSWNPVIVKAVNEDVHLASSPEQKIQWIVGGFYQLRHTENNVAVFYQPVAGGNPVCHCAGGPANSLLLDDDHSRSLAWAVYGQASIPLPADLKFDFAVRYDSDKRYDQDMSVPDGPNNAISHTFGAFQPSGTLSEQFNPDLMGYFTVGKGFRSGGFNAYTDTIAGGLLVPRQFPQETAINYEVGVKSQFLNHHLTVNADLYHTDLSDLQYYLFNQSPPARDVVSIKSVSFNGGEMEVSYTPMSGLTFSATGGLADSYITSHDLDQNDHGKHSPSANLYTSDLSAVYRQPLWGDYGALYRIDYNYKGPICYDSANTYCFHPHGFLNMRLGLENDDYTIALWGKNVLNVQEPFAFQPNSSGFGKSKQLNSEPATYGVELIARF